MTAALERAMKAMSLKAPAKKPDAKAAIWDYIDPALVNAKPDRHAKPIARLNAVGTRKATCASTPKATNAANDKPKRGK